MDRRVPVRSPLRPGLVGYVATVITAGTGLLVLDLLVGHAPGAWAAFAIIAICAAVGELLPVRLSVAMGDEAGVTTSTIFSFALLLAFGPGPAAAAMVIANLLTDLRRRLAFYKTAFNAATEVLGISAAALVLDLSGHGYARGLPDIRSGTLPAIVAAAAAYFVTTMIATTGAVAAVRRTRFLPLLLADLPYQLSVVGSLLALGPVVAVVAFVSLWLVPVLLLPVFVVWRAAQFHVEREYKTYQALHDALTGLPNRLLFRDRLEQAVENARETGTTSALILLDLDHFKEVNDTLGHSVGDVLLREVGERLSHSVRAHDTVARLGGDEFAVLMTNMANEDEARARAVTIVDALRRPVGADELVARLGLEIEGSMGLALTPHDGVDPDELLQFADVALYRSKEMRTPLQAYEAGGGETFFDLALLAELREAVEGEQLILEYQPVLSTDTGKVDVVEALVRWRHPERGLVLPEDFVPAAESTGLVRPLTVYVLARALRERQEMAARGLAVRIAVNVARRNLLDPTFPAEVARLLDAHAVPPEALELEITESSLLSDPERAAGVLAELHRMGVRVSLDDFGAGYSSLSHLGRLPVDALKVDQSFVRGMGRGDAASAAIVRSVVDLGHALGMTVVAEGVEDAVQAAQLVGVGCDGLQGWYVARPMPASKLPAWMRSEGPNTLRTGPPTAAAPDGRPDDGADGQPVRTESSSASSSSSP
ncbi:MAG TPA: EAL domain-containing protein [Mycobacteriales bacterium]|nr:EAL domain-containing protein [Mycobacteriales bacterium]